MKKLFTLIGLVLMVVTVSALTMSLNAAAEEGETSGTEETTKEIVPVTISPESGDITAALAAALEEGKVIGDLTVNLKAGTAYTLSNTLEAAGNVVINGNGATIDASALEAPFVTLNGTEVQAKNVDGTENASYKYVENVIIKDVTITGLPKALVGDAQKTLLENLIVDNVVVDIKGGVNVFDFNGKGYPASLSVNNSTIWSKEGHTGYFLQASGRVKDLDGSQVEYKQKISLTNSTLYKIAQGKQLNNLSGKGQTSLELTMTKSILVDCTQNGNEVRGWLGGQNSTNPTVVYDLNTYWNEGAEQAGWTDSSKQGYDASETSIAEAPEFADAANGDFTLGAETKQNELKIGDPRWLVPVPVKPITEARAWDFTKGAEHADYIIGNAEVWNQTAANGRYHLVANLEDAEMPGLNGEALPGLEGLYMTIDTSVLYGVTANYFLQGNKITVRIPACSKGDEITANFCTSNKAQACELITTNIVEEDVKAETNKPEEHKLTVAEDGDVTILFNCGKGGRVYSITVTPAKDITTSINNVAVAPVVNSIYNLAGQKVDAQYKGIIIVNGKKVLNK